MSLTIKNLELLLQGITLSTDGNGGDGYAHIETGRYKPWAEATVAAAKRRGYRVEQPCRGVYYIYPKAAHP